MASSCLAWSEVARSSAAGSDSTTAVLPKRPTRAQSVQGRLRGSAALDAPRQAETAREARGAASEAAFGAREDLPLVSANARELARPPAESVFEAGLGWLLDGIEP